MRRARGEQKVAVARSKLVSLRPFRRIRTDRIFGLIGIVVVVAATWLLITWEKPEKPVPQVRVDWVLNETTVPPQTVSIVRGQASSQAVPFTIDAANVTNVRVVLTTADETGDVPAEYDTMRFNLTGPPAANVTATKDTFPTDKAEKTFQFDIMVVPVPDVRSVQASSVDEARAKLGDRSSANGTGAWELVVELKDVRDHFATDTGRFSGAECPAPGVPNYCTRDSGQEVRVEIFYTTYQAQYERL